MHHQNTLSGRETPSRRHLHFGHVFLCPSCLDVDSWMNQSPPCLDQNSRLVDSRVYTNLLCQERLRDLVGPCSGTYGMRETGLFNLSTCGQPARRTAGQPSAPGARAFGSFCPRQVGDEVLQITPRHPLMRRWVNTCGVGARRGCAPQ